MLKKNPPKRTYGALALIASGCLAMAPSLSAKEKEDKGNDRKDFDKPELNKKHQKEKEHLLLVRSAGENADFTKVTLPFYVGTSGGDVVAFVITDASTHEWANWLGVNYAPKLANAAGGHGAQKVSIVHGVIDFPATVDFSPHRFIDIGDYDECGAVPFLPFGPDCFAPGAVGNSGYSPLIEMPDGTVLNASHISNSTGKADKVVLNDNFTATIDETKGGAFGKVVYYISLDASVAPGAVLENVTYAEELKNVPADPLGPAHENVSKKSARAGIIAFTNGQTGLGNPNRQGLNSTILDGPVDGFTELSPPVPFNILQFIPDVPKLQTSGELYSPLWDVHFATWKADVVPLADRTRQDDFEAVRNNPNITNPSGGPFGPAGPVVANCPIISIDLE